MDTKVSVDKRGKIGAGLKDPSTDEEEGVETQIEKHPKTRPPRDKGKQRGGWGDACLGSQLRQPRRWGAGRWTPEPASQRQHALRDTEGDG